jgi:hypothetical protein
MPNTGNPRIRHSIQFIKQNELDAELHVVGDDEAASLLWAAQWLDEHREYAMTAIRLDDTADPNNADDDTTTLVLTLDHAYERQPGHLGPWPHGVPPPAPGPS